MAFILVKYRLVYYIYFQFELNKFVYVYHVVQCIGSWVVILYIRVLYKNTYIEKKESVKKYAQTNFVSIYPSI